MNNSKPSSTQPLALRYSGLFCAVHAFFQGWRTGHYWVNMAEGNNKSPAYQRYPDKWLVDTKRLSWFAKGIYADLIETIWLQFQDTCSIPDDSAIISSELGCSIDDWERARAEIMSEHRPLMLVTETNRLLSRGLLKEAIKQRERREKLRANGRKGGRPKNQKVILEKPNDNQNKSLPSPSPSSSPTPLSEKEEPPISPKGDSKGAGPRKKTYKDPVYSEAFSEFWTAYPNKVGKGKAFESWEKISCDRFLTDIMSAIERYKVSDQWTKDGGTFIPHPATWLNQRRWEDEPPESAYPV